MSSSGPGEQPFAPVIFPDMRDVFEPGGALSGILPGFELARAGCARLCGRACACHRQHLLAEAGTGTARALPTCCPPSSRAGRSWSPPRPRPSRSSSSPKTCPRRAALGREVHVAVLKGVRTTLPEAVAGFGPMLCATRATRRPGRISALDPGDGDWRPGRAPVRAVRGALGRGRSRRRPLRRAPVRALSSCFAEAAGAAPQRRSS